MIGFAGIKRSLEFSPNHRGNDNAIFSLTVDQLKAAGASVAIYSEDELILSDRIAEQNVFTMSRSKQSVQKLQEFEEEGRLVVNSGFAIENCYRANMTRTLLDAGVPYPKSFLVRTNKCALAELIQLGGKNFWIKRGDFHAIHKEDVSFAHTACEANDILKEYHIRGIAEAIVSEHLHGDLVKFYGVRGTGFFYWFYPYEFNHSKFNAEAVNGSAHYYAFDVDRLRQIGDEAAAALGVDVFGGDAIVSHSGQIQIIDLNDWPSFAPCREEAAKAIAQCLLHKGVARTGSAAVS